MRLDKLRKPRLRIATRFAASRWRQRFAINAATDSNTRWGKSEHKLHTAAIDFVNDGRWRRVLMIARGLPDDDVCERGYEGHA